MIDTKRIKENLDVFNSLLLIDIDNFFLFNQKFGREMGDKILEFIKKILKNNLLKEDVIFSCGSDEYLIFSSIKNKNNLIEYTNSLKDILTKSLYDVYTYNITFSVGLTLVSNQADIKEYLLKLRLAINEAKTNGKNLISYIN